MKGRARLKRFFLLPVLAAAALVVGFLGAWRYGVRPAFEDALFRATGWKAQVGTLTGRWRRLIAEDVVLLGSAPFDQTPLASIGRIEIELGGSLFAPRPTSITVDSGLITYLSVGAGRNAVDNFRGDGRRSARVPGGPNGKVTEVRVRNCRFESFVRLQQPTGPLRKQKSIAVRADGLQVHRTTDGRVTVSWEGVVVDILGAATVRIPRIDASKQAGSTKLSARDLTVTVPGAGTVLRTDTLAVERHARGIDLTLQAAPSLAAGTPPADGGGPGTVAGRLSLTMRDDGDLRGAEGTVSVLGMPLAPLAALVQTTGIAVAGGRADARFVLTKSQPEGEPGALSGSADIAVTALDLHHPRLDRVPWKGLSFAWSASGGYAPRARRWDVSAGKLTALGVAVGWSGWLTRAPALAGELRVAPEPRIGTGCAEALASWPASLRSRLEGLTLSGRFGPTGRLRFDARNWDDLELALSFSPLCKVTAEPAVIATVDRIAPAMAARDFVPIDTLPGHVVGAFLTAEDGSFRRHDGFDLEMIRRALAHDLAMGTLAKGASTLSQQVVKNLFLGPERTIARKLAELVLTWRLEATLSKDRIVELYLNVVELGPNVRGLGPAAKRYFGKNARDLTPMEAAHLAALLPNPVGFARRFRSGRIDDGWRLKLYDLLGRMQRNGYLSASALQAARESPFALREP